MSQLLLVLADVVAVLVLAFVLYFPRYRRRDMVVAILGVNVGVLSVATLLSTASVTVGLGLGLFGVLSIIRLRSEELDQEEVAYYFSALALGMLGGVEIENGWLSPTLMVVILVALFLGDHPRVLPASRHEVVKLDDAFTDEALLRARLESVLGGTVRRMKVKRIDLVVGTTTVDVRYTID